MDASPVAPLHEHLLQVLPPCDLTESTGDINRGVGGESGDGDIPSLLPPSPSPMHQQQPGPISIASGDVSNSSSPSDLLRSSAGVGERVDRISSTGSGIDNDGGDNSRNSQGLLPTNSGLHSRLGGQATVAAMLSPSSPSSSSAVPLPSLRALVAAAALARDSESAAATMLGGETRAVGEGEEATVVSEGSAMTATAVPPMPSEEVAPVSGSFTISPVSCVCCSRIDAVVDAGRSTGSNVHNANITNDLPRSAVTPPVGRQHPPSSSPTASASQALFRRLPCGHSAHEACLIPLILESVGRGDPSRCLCPLDSFPIFPVLSRRRRGIRRRRPGSDGRASTATAEASTTSDDHRRGTRSASSATAVPPASRTAGGNGMDRHARAAAARELLRRNAAAGFGGGGTNPSDVLGIALFGSGLAQPHPPSPPSVTGQATVNTSLARLEGGQCENITLSVRESGLMRRRIRANVTSDGDKRNGGDGNRIRGRCRNIGRGVAGGAGPREGSPCSESGLQNGGLFLGGEGIVDAAGGASRTGGVEEGDIGTAARAQRHQQRKPPCLVRGSTITGGGGRGDRIRQRGSCNGRTSATVVAADSASGLAVSTLPLASNARGSTDDSRGSVGHSPPQERECTIRDRGSGGRGRGQGIPSASAINALGSSLAVKDATVEEHLSGQPIVAAVV